MSGICGIIDLGGAGADAGQLALMTKRLERRGPDATRHWCEGSAALGHTLLATTREAEVEILPLRDAESGCVITADVRLDNREILLPALGLADLSRVVGDGELILRSYLLWGEGCLDHLHGDFAFAIWDPRSSRLFCARDHLGMRQLIYCHIAGSVFAFATEPKAILALDRVSLGINEGRIADFLENLEDIDFTSTFFDDIYRLPPAHCMSLDIKAGMSADCSDLQIRRYWTLKPGPKLELPTNEAYEAAFVAVFTEAVRCRLRCNGPVGSMLSGGIDSSSVTAIAAQILAETGRGPLQTFSAIGPDPATCHETEGIMESVNQPELDSHLVNYAALGELMPDLLAMSRQIDEPFDGDMNLIRAVYLRAHRAGIRVMLDGVSADVVLTSGTQLDRLMRSGKVLQVLAQARGIEKVWGPNYPTWKTVLGTVWRVFVPIPIRKLRRNYVDKRYAEKCRVICPDFAKRINLPARLEKFYSRHVYRRMDYGLERADHITRAQLTVGRERYDRVAAALAMEPRDPYLDLRVVGFCLRLPDEQLSAGGWYKIILRRAMVDRVPDIVRWRRGRTHLAPKYTRALFTACPDWLTTLADEKKTLGKFVRKKLTDDISRRQKMAFPDYQMINLLFFKWWLDKIKSNQPN